MDPGLLHFLVIPGDEDPETRVNVDQSDEEEAEEEDAFVAVLYPEDLGDQFGDLVPLLDDLEDSDQAGQLYQLWKAAKFVLVKATTWEHNYQLEDWVKWDGSKQITKEPGG